MATVASSTSGRPPSRRCQKPWPMTTTLGPAGTTSSEEKERPRWGRTPSVANRLEDTSVLKTRSGPPSPVMMARGVNTRNAASDVKAAA